MNSKTNSIGMNSELAFIHENVKVGTNFKFGRFVIIEDDVEIGDNVTLGNFVRIMPGTRIGNDVDIMDYVKLMNDTKIGNKCKIDDYVNTSGYVDIGNNVRIKRGSMIGQAVKIEDDVWIGSNITTTRIKYPKVISEETENEEWIVIKKGSMIGSASVLLAGTTIGEGAVVAASATITKDCDAYGIYIGSPAKLVRHRKKD